VLHVTRIRGITAIFYSCAHFTLYLIQYFTFAPNNRTHTFADSTVLLLFLDLRVHALVLSFYYCLIFTYAFVGCSIAWFPGIVPVGFLLAEVRPPTLSLILKLILYTFNKKFVAKVEPPLHNA
jgi:hypothetical protein